MLGTNSQTKDNREVLDENSNDKIFEPLTRINLLYQEVSTKY